MNEKIKELAEQSGIKFTPFTVDGEEYDFDEVEVEDSDMLQNFAELIIRECTKKCDAISSFTHIKNPKAYEASTSIKHNILEHFGVDYV